jgi:DNA-directed RNA polymerase subunit RPC12/RpoP
MEVDKKKLKALDDLVKKVSGEKKYFKVCPNCGHEFVKPVYLGLGGKMVAESPQMKCPKCGFYGFVIEKKLEKKKK